MFELFRGLPLKVLRVVDDVPLANLRSIAANYNRAPFDHRISVRMTKDGGVAIEKVAR